jgi:hypothetical protein
VSKHAQLDRSLKQRLARLLSAALSESEITQNPAVSLILSRSDAGALRKYCDGEPTPKKIKDLPKLIAATEIKNAFPRNLGSLSSLPESSLRTGEAPIKARPSRPGRFSRSEWACGWQPTKRNQLLSRNAV